MFRLRSMGSYVAHVSREMDDALRRARSGGAGGARARFDIATDRMIIFGDLHRGARNAADDFRQNERAYCAALAYYFRMGHRLVVLGDAEELWEESPATILSEYRHTLELEAQFHRDGRYCRVWGNHDDEWQYEPRVRLLLDPIYGGRPLNVYEALFVDVEDDGNRLGFLFLVHGHQGDTKSSQWSWLSRRVIRYLWRPFQRFTGASVNTPATSWDLRDRLNQAMYAWSVKEKSLLLVASHTHEPVFKSRSHEAQIKEHLAALEAEAGKVPSREQREEMARLQARLEWVRMKTQESGGQRNGIHFQLPCYFNPGCCCYDDGDITGIELAEGQIRLIRWPDEDNEPCPHILAADSLREVFRDCS